MKIRESTNPDNITSQLVDTLVQGYQRETATSSVVATILDNFSAWLVRFKERNPQDEEDFGYNHAIDDVIRAIEQER